MRHTPYYKKTNFFGYDIFSPLVLFSGQQEFGNIEKFIRDQLVPFFEKLHMSPDASFKLIKNTCEDACKKYTCKKNKIESLEEAETWAEAELYKNLFDDEKKRNILNNEIYVRAFLIFSQISGPLREFFKEKSNGIDILDIGCGDGLVLKHLREHEDELGVNWKNTVLADLHKTDYRVKEVKKDKLFLYQKLEPVYDKIEFDNDIKKNLNEDRKFDCILLLTVLHHSLVPFQVYQAAVDRLRTPGMMIIIESCIGISPSLLRKFPSVFRTYPEIPEKYDLKYNYLLYNQERAIKRFLGFNLNVQVMYATFIDWFYNHVLRFYSEDEELANVLVTYEFASPGEWNLLFEDNKNIKCKYVCCEGFDQITVPEFHTIHVLHKGNNSKY